MHARKNKQAYPCQTSPSGEEAAGHPQDSQPEGPGERAAAQMSQPLLRDLPVKMPCSAHGIIPPVSVSNLTEQSKQESARKGGKQARDGWHGWEVFVIHGPHVHTYRHPSPPLPSPPPLFASTNRTEPFRQSLLVADAPICCLFVAEWHEGTSRRTRDPTRAFGVCELNPKNQFSTRLERWGVLRPFPIRPVEH